MSISNLQLGLLCVGPQAKGVYTFLVMCVTRTPTKQPTSPPKYTSIHHLYERGARSSHLKKMQLLVTPLTRQSHCAVGGTGADLGHTCTSRHSRHREFHKP